MVTQFYVHIGMPKAGSSSIQANLFMHRSFLLERGINYLDLHKNHSGTVGSLLADVPHRFSFNVIRGINTPEKAAKYNKKVSERFEAALRNNASGKFIISAESISEVSLDGLRRLQGFLRPYASGIRIICYVRDPLDFISSAVQQRIKSGVSATTKPPVPNYRGRLEKFFHVFGRDNVDVRILRPNELINSDLLCDFLAAIGESPDLLDGHALHKVNESLCHEALLICEALNKRVPAVKERKKNPDRAPVNRWLRAIRGKKFGFKPDMDPVIRATLDADLEWLHSAIGRPVFTLEGQDGSQPEWNQETVESLALVLNTMAAKIARQESLLRLSKALLVKANEQWEIKEIGRELFDDATSAKYSYELSRAFHFLKEHREAIKAAKQAMRLDLHEAKYNDWFRSLQKYQGGVGR